MRGEQLCKAAIVNLEQVRSSEQQPGTHSVLWGFLPVLAKATELQAPSLPAEYRGSVWAGDRHITAHLIIFREFQGHALSLQPRWLDQKVFSYCAERYRIKDSLGGG